jgi:uncharacterized protein
MKYTDKVYGQQKITEPIILDLINCPSLQRLKLIDQAGYSKAFYPNQSHSRFEHSVGVYLLLNKYQASLEEQVAGLIHDVSHSVFSHAIDYILDQGTEKEQSHQDNIFTEFVKNSEIPEILNKHNLDTNHILNEENFPLLETNLPSLCADRIDYSFRSAVLYNEISTPEINKLLSSLITINNQWVFKNESSASEYANLYSLLNRKYWAGQTTGVMFKTVGECVKYAISKKYVSANDLYTTDQQVLTKIKKQLPADSKLKQLFNRMSNKVAYQDNPKKSNTPVFCKSRVVDPLVQKNDKIVPLSSLKPSWKKRVKQESQPTEYYLHFSK